MSQESGRAPVGFIQLHDATIKDFQVLAAGRISIRFSDVSVYRSVAARQYDVWIHDATLMLSGVSMLSVDGSWRENDDDYVLDDDICTVNGEKGQWHEIADTELHSIRFGLLSGACISIACARATLTIADAGELVRCWDDDRAE